MNSKNHSDALTLSSLLVSRVCHDLLSPVGAVSSGMEVYEKEDDPAMREEALVLINESTRRALSLLSFFRLAYGSASMMESEMDLVEAREVLDALLDKKKHTLIWRSSVSKAPKGRIRLIAGAVRIMTEYAPRGGELTLYVDEGMIDVALISHRLYERPETDAMLAGDATEMTPQLSAARILYLAVQEQNAEIFLKSEGKDKKTLTIAWEGVTSPQPV